MFAAPQTGRVWKNAVPRKLFVPDLVITVIAAPAAIPSSASMLPVVMLTDSIVSAGGM